MLLKKKIHCFATCATFVLNKFRTPCYLVESHTLSAAANLVNIMKSEKENMKILFYKSAFQLNLHNIRLKTDSVETSSYRVLKM